MTMEEREKEGKQFEYLEDIFDRYQGDERKKELEKIENEWKKEGKKESKEEEEERWEKKGEEEKVHHHIHDLNNMDGEEIRREGKSGKESYETEVENFQPESHQVYLKVDFQETEIEEKSEAKEEEKPQNQKRGKKSLEGNHNNVEPIFLASGNESEQEGEMKGRKASSSPSSHSFSSFKISSYGRIGEEERFVEERINLEEEEEGNHWQEVCLRVEEGTERKEEDDLTQGIQVERNCYANEGRRKESERKETGGKESEGNERREKEGSEGEVTRISTSDQMARRNKDGGTAPEEGKDRKRNQSRMLLDEEDGRKAGEGEKEIEEKEETKRKHGERETEREGEEKEIESEEEEMESEEERIWKESCKRSRCVRRSITSIELDEGEETPHSFPSSEERKGRSGEERKERSGEEREKDEEDGDWYVKRDGEWIKESEWEDGNKRRESQDLIPRLPFSPSFSLSTEEVEREKEIFPYHEYERTISSDSWTSSTTSSFDSEEEDRKKEEGQEKKESGREGKRKSSLLSAEKKKERDERRRKERRRSRSVSWGTAETIEFLPFPREVIELSKEGNVSKLAFHEPSNAWFLSLGFFFTGSLICYRFYSSFYFLFSDPDSQSTASYSYHF